MRHAPRRRQTHRERQMRRAWRAWRAWRTGGLLAITAPLTLAPVACGRAPGMASTTTYPTDGLHGATIAGVPTRWARPDDSTAPRIAGLAADGRRTVETFFGAPFPRPFTLRLYPTRAALDAHWASTWAGAGFASQCWMVASGVASELAMLSPRAWTREACEHRADDTARVRRLVAHELVHVYHAQRNPRPDFADMDALAWLVEGVAVLASGQLDAEHDGRAREALVAGRGPASLASAWSGAYRYGVAGSLVAWVDATYGRATLVRLLAVTTPGEALAVLGTDEPTLLAQWRTWVLASNGTAGGREVNAPPHREPPRPGPPAGALRRTASR